MLDINWNSYRNKTTKDMMAEADTFGLVFLRDLSTIKGRPLTNIIAPSFNVIVDVLGVKDFSNPWCREERRMPLVYWRH